MHHPGIFSKELVVDWQEQTSSSLDATSLAQREPQIRQSP